MKKLNYQNGETIVETLISILVISVCFIILSGAIVTAVRVNHSAKEQTISTDFPEEKELEDFEVTIDGIPVNEVTGFAIETSNGDIYYYYETLKDSNPKPDAETIFQE